MNALRLFFTLSLLSIIGCGDKSDDTGSSSYICPTVGEDNCMTEERYQQCLAVVDTCESGNIIIAESCPYASFSCAE